MKKFTQVLEDDEKIRKQLEALVSPTCSCKQAEGCVVRGQQGERMCGHVCVDTCVWTRVCGHA